MFVVGGYFLACSPSIFEDVFLLVMGGGGEGENGIFLKLFYISFSCFLFIVGFEPYAALWHADVFSILTNTT